MKYLSFFSGALGLDLGLEKAGFDPLLMCEVDKFCISTIKTNKPNVPLIYDIRDYSTADIKKIAGVEGTDIDLVVGGPPCQAFSTAGSRKSFEDERGNVFIKYLEIATELEPKFIVIENVRGLLSAPLKHRPHKDRGEGFSSLNQDEKAGGALKYILSFLEEKGYGVSFNLYNSANYGTPQVRERVVIVASRDGKKLPYLNPTHSDDASWGLPKWHTFEHAVSGLSKADNEECTQFPENRLMYYKIIGPGGNWKSLPVDLQKKALGNAYNSGGGKTGFLRRLACDKPSPTLLTSPIMPATSLAHPVENRPLSIAEYKRIQEFPDNWFFAGKTKDKYRQIGNAVPMSLGFAIGNLIKNHMAGADIEPPAEFKFSRYRFTNDTNWLKSIKE